MGFAAERCSWPRFRTTGLGQQASSAGCAAQPAPCYSSDMSLGPGRQEPEVEWTGVAPDTAPVEPLTAETFIARLESLTEEVAVLDRLKRAFDEQRGGIRR